MISFGLHARSLRKTGIRASATSGSERVLSCPGGPRRASSPPKPPAGPANPQSHALDYAFFGLAAGLLLSAFFFLAWLHSRLDQTTVTSLQSLLFLAELHVGRPPQISGVMLYSLHTIILRHLAATKRHLSVDTA